MTEQVKQPARGRRTNGKGEQSQAQAPQSKPAGSPKELPHSSRTGQRVERRASGLIIVHQ